MKRKKNIWRKHFNVKTASWVTAKSNPNNSHALPQTSQSKFLVLLESVCHAPNSECETLNAEILSCHRKNSHSNTVTQ